MHEILRNYDTIVEANDDVGVGAKPRRRTKRAALATV
jgi:hypothetical protein